MSGKSRTSAEKVAKYADMFTAMGTEPRLRIMQLLLSAHPDGMVVGEIQGELGIPQLDAVASSRKAQERRLGEGPPRKNLPLVHRQHRRAAGAARLSVRRMLYPQPGG